MRAAKFQVDRRLLADALHMPADATITAIWGDHDGRVVNIIADDPSLPEASEPHETTPTLYDRRTEWDWNVPA